MTIEQLNSFIDKPDTLISVLDNYCLLKDIECVIKEYDIKKHKVNNPISRPDKLVEGENGEIIKKISVNRIALPIQEHIVTVAAAFLGTPDVEALPDGEEQETMVKLIEKCREDNKYEYKFPQLVRTVKSEKQAAFLFYSVPVESEYYTGINTVSKFATKIKLLSESLGDRLYPVLDDSGNMIAFGREYETKSYSEDGREIKTKHFDLYTDQLIHYYERGDSGAWVYVKNVNHYFTKIPVVYASQKYTDWHTVQSLIDRLEEKISNHADTNDYFDSPIYFLEGDVQGFADKKDQGKVLIGTQGAKVSVLTWDSAPESMKMEIENLLTFIDKYTHTPDISFDKMKGLGAFSGTALMMFFLDAHVKAKQGEEIFGEFEQRVLNFMKAAFVVFDFTLKPALRMSIKPKFNYLLPNNTQELVQTITSAVNNKLISQESGVKLTGLSQNPNMEIEKIKEERQENADFDKKNNPTEKV